MSHRNKDMGTVLVDMDGVLSDFDRGVSRVIRTKYPELIQHPTHPEIECWNNYWPKREHFYFADDFPEHRELVRSISDRPGFFRALEPYDDAIGGWNKIINLGYTPRICSSPIRTNPNCIEEKLEWLEEHFVPKFGRYVVETAILNGHKDKYDAVALIDDKPRIEGSENAVWTHILRSREYNRDVVTDFRLDYWYGNRLQDALKLARKRYIDLGKSAIS